MLQEAKKQLQSISIDEIKDILKRNIKSDFDKMIITDETKIKRTNFFYSILIYKQAERKLNALRFPLYDSIKNDFSIFEGGVAKFGEKVVIKDDHFINKFLKIKGAKIHNMPSTGVENALDIPLSFENGEISEIQEKYFLPEFTYVETCKTCNGYQYITCKNPDCKGKHSWNCDRCFGSGQVTCVKCKGEGYIKCTSCNGKGSKTKSEFKNGQSYQIIEKCIKCKGKGEIPCTKCGGNGKEKCIRCGGEGKIICDKCYSDHERYGLIDCPKCHTIGFNAQFAFVETIINDLKTSKLVTTGDKIVLDNEIVHSHVNNDLKTICIYKNINGEVTDKSDEISSKIIQTYENDLKLSKTDYPMILKAELMYQVIPVVEISYKHILTNEYYQLKIVDLWNNPEIIYNSKVEDLKDNTDSITKTIGGVFAKVFKTKGYLKKEDRKTEIKLMIYMTKADGKIEEHEKEYLSEEISNLKDFNNSEKKELFNLMNSRVLPELTSNDIKFSDPEKGKEIIEKLSRLAHSDGELVEAEKTLIEKIKSLLKIE